MIKLNSDTFRRAIEKAQTARPACSLTHTDEINFTFTVARSGGGVSIVDIWFTGGVTWTSCDCAAGIGLHRNGWPQPCYHVAAAALSLGLLPAALPVGAVLDPAPECAAGHQVPPQLVDMRELAPLPAPALMADAERARLWAYIRSFGRRLRGVCDRRGWLSPRSARA